MNSTLIPQSTHRYIIGLLLNPTLIKYRKHQKLIELLTIYLSRIKTQTIVHSYHRSLSLGLLLLLMINNNNNICAFLEKNLQLEATKTFNMGILSPLPPLHRSLHCHSWSPAVQHQLMQSKSIQPEESFLVKSSKKSFF